MERNQKKRRIKVTILGERRKGKEKREVMEARKVRFGTEKDEEGKSWRKIQETTEKNTNKIEKTDEKEKKEERGREGRKENVGKRNDKINIERREKRNNNEKKQENMQRFSE